MKHLEHLNEMQREAAVHKDGPLLIIAGAGTGKTSTLTHRILNLIKEGVPPSEILAITLINFLEIKAFLVSEKQKVARALS
ncbi:MAG: ATP-dependent DNA helicase PcrA [Candidatus Azambacteria bacterium GW2011_GWA1_44_9]|uniref:ATP-dependent DNA helicase PcrA n=1 Tax=Candidatus Azambacteria bacterium GW2011_GWA1_44_9 TaxID=1618610 RepID=A0A0G1KEG6_9BACT|nr:MAG: ATP-dependent DNA helicase PcrA [Candidatus Azambacteria bacterium GW2011_GWA1_44_9]